MVAYSYKRRFIVPIMVGLGLPLRPEDISMAIADGAPLDRPKRQTIRANGKRRHARPGETLQLYYAQRSPQHCRKIADSRCSEVLPVKIRFAKHRRPNDSVLLPNHGYVNRGYEEGELDHFAVSDGFLSWEEMRDFWRAEHPGVTDFDGVLVRWEPLT